MEINENDYIKLIHLSQRLKIPIMLAHIIVESFIDGRLHQKFEGRSHTWVRNFWNLITVYPCDLPLVATNFGAGYLSLKQISAAVSALNKDQHEISNLGPISNSTYGILCGRGSNAESFESYALTTPITHGTGANQLSHRAQNATTQEYTAGTKTWNMNLVRLFDNLSGSTISVTETAIVIYTSAYGYKVMLCRDLLGAPVDVLNNGVLSITYPLSIVFPD